MSTSSDISNVLEDSEILLAESPMEVPNTQSPIIRRESRTLNRNNDKHDRQGFDSTNRSSSNKQKQDMLKTINYKCDFCDYNAIGELNILKHQRSYHREAKFYCKRYEYKTALKRDLIRHKTNKH